MSGRRGDEAGVVLPLTALLLVVLVGAVAFAVDLGILYNERRQDQTSVDASALSGARLMLEGASTDAMFEDIVELSYANLWSPGFDLDTWYAMWDGCVDGGAAASGYGDELVLSPGYASPGGTAFGDTSVGCVTFDDAADPERMRVHLPEITVDAVFASVLGVDGWPSSAFAEVGIADPRGPGGVLPYGLPSGSTGYSEVCIKASSQGPSECDGGTTGNYGPLDLSVFGLLDAPVDCAEVGNKASRAAINTAQGLDHMLSTTDGNPPIATPIIREDAECLGDQEDDPNTADTDTGVDTGAFWLGMLGDVGESSGTLDLPEGVDGRLRGIHPALDAVYEPATTNTIAVQSSREIEDVPLWAFLSDDLVPGVDPATTVPARCLPEVFDTFATQAELEDVLADAGLGAAQYGWWTASLTYPVDLATTQNLRGCFDDYNTGLLVPGVAPSGVPYESVLFGRDAITGDGYTDSDGVSHTIYDIEYSRRFGWMPVIWDTTFPGGESQVHIKAFAPVFINTIFAKCKGSGECSMIHSPGEAIVGSKMATNDKLDAASGFNIQMPMLPLEVRDSLQRTLSDVPPVELIR